MGATIAYNNNIIHQASGNQTFTLNTADNYLEGDIVVQLTESGGGSGGVLVEPSYYGLSYGFSGGGNWVGYTSKNNCISLFEVLANHELCIFAATSANLNRFRIGFFSGKTLADFLDTINNSHAQETIYTGESINGSDTAEDLTDRYFYTPSTSGVIVAFTNNAGNLIPAYCVDMDASGGGSTLITKNITANGTYNAVDDNADGYSIVTVNVPSGDSDKFKKYGWDFKTSLTDSITGITATLEGTATQTTDGVEIDTSNDRIEIPNFVKSVGALFSQCTIEIDIGDMILGGSTSNHHRFFMPTSANGLIYRNNGKWAFYNGSWATDSNITDFDYFANSTMKIIIDSSYYWHVYKDDVLVYEPNRPYNVASASGLLYIGSTGESCLNTVIEGLRIEYS